MWLIAKATNNIAFICKIYDIDVILKELGLIGTSSNTYEQISKTVPNILGEKNNILENVFNLKNTNDDFNCLLTISSIWE